MEEHTGRTPPALQRKPKMDALLRQYIEAFHILSNFRQPNGLLSLADIIALGTLLAEDDIIGFIRLMTEADKIFYSELTKSRTLKSEEQNG